MVGDPPREHDPGATGLSKNNTATDAAIYVLSPQNVPIQHQGTLGYGDIWTWTAIDAETKLIPCWYVGRRDAGAAREFIMDLASRLTNRIQLTTDGHRAYLSAVDEAWAGDVDYAMLVKLFGAEPAGEARYSPPKCTGIRKDAISGNPDPAHISTSYVERQNLTMRMSMRHFTRLTNGHSKKLANHCHAVALHFMHYNFARINQAVRCSPAMEAGVDNHLWSIEEIAALADSN
jgi:IS1 family transposase